MVSEFPSAGSTFLNMLLDLWVIGELAICACANLFIGRALASINGLGGNHIACQVRPSFQRHRAGNCASIKRSRLDADSV